MAGDHILTRGYLVRKQKKRGRSRYKAHALLLSGEMYLVLVEVVDLILSEVVDLFLGGGDLLPAGGRHPEPLLVHPGEVVLVVLLVLHVGDPIKRR